MGKRTIEWHEDCLRNMNLTFGGMCERLKDLKFQTEKLLKDIRIYEAQIKRAKNEGRGGFDSERFNIKIGK